MADTMLKAAYGDLLVVNRELLYPLTDDDAALGVIEYHIQQAVEKSLKALLESKGEDYRAMGHSIGKCLRAVCNYLPGVLSDMTVAAVQPYTNILTDWEASGRYPSDYMFILSELRKLNQIAINLYNECANYLGEDCFCLDIAKEG